MAEFSYRAHAVRGLMSGLERMVLGYLQAAMWTDNDDEGSLETNVKSSMQFTEEACAEATLICAGFLVGNWELIMSTLKQANGNYDMGELGRDLWTSNGGCEPNFSSRGPDAEWEALHAAAQGLPGRAVYVVDPHHVAFDTV